MKDEEIGHRIGDKAARKEMKYELSRAKKTLREREKELVKLRLEINSKQMIMQGRPPAGVGENVSFSAKDPSAAGGTAAPKVDGTQTSTSDKEQPSSAGQVQLKTLQKRVRDLTNDSRVKKQKIEE